MEQLEQYKTAIATCQAQTLRVARENQRLQEEIDRLRDGLNEASKYVRLLQFFHWNTPDVEKRNAWLKRYGPFDTH